MLIDLYKNNNWISVIIKVGVGDLLLTLTFSHWGSMSV